MEIKIVMGVEKVIVLYGCKFKEWVILNCWSINLIKVKVLWRVIKGYKLFNWIYFVKLFWVFGFYKKSKECVILFVGVEIVVVKKLYFFKYEFVKLWVNYDVMKVVLVS